MRPYYVFALGVAGLPAFAQPEVERILTNACASCHNAQMAQAKLRLDSLSALGQGGVSGAVVVPGNSASSLLLQRLTSADRNTRMPPGGMALPADQIAAIRQWIDSGAPGMHSVDYARDVQPIFRRACYGCHSGSRPQARLRLDAKPTSVITPGHSETSRLIHRIEGKGNEQRMPLKGTPLSNNEIATLRRWIDAGAAWPAEPVAVIEKHWSYQKPIRLAVPAVRGSTRNPIDAFLLARLEKEGLSFSPEASRETLIRRLTLDLTGLPPTLQETAAFLQDKRTDAYEQLVERLLGSPHYGERWARPWLDLARYADTNGFEADRRRMMWKYRDWVIQAFNKDMGFDQFTIEQLAGDMLPNASIDQQIATGFHRNTMYNEEGGVDKDESHFEVMVDRVNTTGTVWLATSIGCTQCHNHKYDPFTQKEYYQLMAFFNNTLKVGEANGSSSTKYREAVLELATPDQETKRRELKTRIASLELKLKTQTPELDEEQAAWEKSVISASGDWRVLTPTSLQSKGGATLRKLEDQSILASGENPQQDTYVIETPVAMDKLNGVRLEALPDASLPRGGPGRDTYGNFIVTAIRVEAGNGGTWRTIYFNRIVNNDGRGPARQLWTIDASRDENRVARQIVLATGKPFELNGATKLRFTILMNSDLIGQGLGRFRLSIANAAEPATIVKVPAKLRPILEKAHGARTEAQRRQLSEAFRAAALSLKASRDELKELKNQLDKMDIVTAMVMKESSDERPHDFLRARGGFSAKAEKVFADVPAALGGMPAGMRYNRLGLAQWLVNRENPLTARVAVNRVWEQYFGRGIVETSEDFGSQGAAPSHPELLDWMAVEFMDRGWSLKSLHRLIVTSRAYRQSSKLTPQLLQADPYNKLISRGPRFRMEAEMIRDHALAASGLLSRKVGGASVFPYQPEGVWDVPYSDEKWAESKGEDRYRRGLYTFVRRSALYPSMMNFDATSREFCTVRRIRTNTPLQALTTLNDPAFFEMAQAFAQRVMAEGGSRDRSRIEYAYQLSVGRQPKPVEVDTLQGWLEKERSYFKGHLEEARRLGAADGDVQRAAWTMLANVLLNLDESLTKE